MFVLVLAAEADETRQAITFLIVCLIGVAVLLSLLTAWYWRYTSPSRALEAQAFDGAASDPPPPVPVLVPAGPAYTGDDPAIAGVEAENEGVAPSPLVAVAAAPRIEVAERPAMAIAARRIEVADRLGCSGSNDSSDDRGPGDEIGDGLSAGLSDEAWASVMKSAFDKLSH